jgi:hypothetical protein
MPIKQLSGVAVTAVNGGLGRRAPDDQGVSAIFFHGYTGPTSPATFGTAPRRVVSLAAAEALGITEAWQLSSTQLTHYHISEFFRFAPNGELWLMFIPPADVRTTATLLNEIQTAAAGRVRRIGHVNTYATDLYASLPAALDSAADSLWNTGRPAYSVVETNANGSLVETRRFVAKIVAQDQATLRVITSTPTGQLPTWARNASCMGTYLGVRAGFPSNESAGWVRTKNIQTANRFLTPAFTDESLLSSKDKAARETINGDQLIMLRDFTDYPGVYFENDCTQALATSDYLNVADVEVIQEAHREARAAATPFVNGPITLLADGTIDGGDAADIETAVGAGLREMARAGKISGFRVVLDTTTDVAGTGRIALRISIQIRPNTSYIDISLGFVASL